MVENISVALLCVGLRSWKGVAAEDMLCWFRIRQIVAFTFCSQSLHLTGHGIDWSADWLNAHSLLIAVSVRR